MNTFTKGTPVTLINGLRAGYVYLGHTAKRDIILNVVTGEVKQVYQGRLMATERVLGLILKAA